MRALIMAGGEGSRLELGEKPLVTVGEVPMIRRVIDAFAAAGHEPVVVLSPRTPMTRNWCRVQGIPAFLAGGTGYVEDLAETVQELEETGPVFTCTADLPCLTPELIVTMGEAYRSAGTPALSVWVPGDLLPHGASTDGYREVVEGVTAYAAGINIITGTRNTAPQEETRLLIRSRRLAFHVNTREDLERVRAAVAGQMRPGPS